MLSCCSVTHGSYLTVGGRESTSRSCSVRKQHSHYMVHILQLEAERAHAELLQRKKEQEELERQRKIEEEKKLALQKKKEERYGSSRIKIGIQKWVLWASILKKGSLEFPQFRAYRPFLLPLLMIYLHSMLHPE